MANRWMIYQRERFPVLRHGPLLAAFSFSAVSLSALLGGRIRIPEVGPVLTAFGCTFLFFLQLRIADEFKDCREDARYRPYRPVPRGLVSLGELGAVGIAGALIQLCLAIWLHPALVLLLLLAWSYMALMSKEFFAPRWLKAHPLTYLWTHMLILPLITFYATACEWLAIEGCPPLGLAWFLVVSFFNGMVIEIGRKIRAPQDEEHGVETYSALWGRTPAVAAWLASMLLGAAAALPVAFRIEALAPVAGLLIVMLLAAAVLARLFLSRPLTRFAQWFEPVSGVWILVVNLALGAIPLLLRL